MSDVTLHLGDCLEYMRGMADGSVDAVVTDPPYGIEFCSGWTGSQIKGDLNTSLRDEIVRHFS
jgi:DNA modification methylase